MILYTYLIFFQRGQIGDRKTIKSSQIVSENSPQKSTKETHTTNKYNATLKTSQKYEGVRSKELNNGDIAYYVRWTDTNDERHERKVGTKASNWNEKVRLKRMH